MILISQEIAYFLSGKFVFNFNEIKNLLISLKNKKIKEKIIEEISIEIKKIKKDNIPFKNVLLEKESILDIIKNLVLEYDNPVAMEYGLIVKDGYDNVYCTSLNQLSFLKWFIKSKLNFIFDEFSMLFNKFIILKSN